MKKLIVLFAGVTLAAAVNAAAVTWSAANIKTAPSNSALESGYMAYFFTASETVTQAAVTADFAAGKGADWVAQATYSQLSANGVAKQTKVGNYAANETINAFLVIVNASSAADATYFTSVAKSVTINAAGSDATLSFGTMATASWNEIAPAPVPEPTSGLLLLIGMAGLALKRKHV